ncbi:response regulator transcription factor [Cohnella nanjingensis]|uniref:Response regulator transcription factor n=1 Tax=Cohnella nanjingensis TaxID=1387779 RepID=A0A7X0RSY5_9BACL|nr:response regulator transcription factor [Cohnella nanjingensis]MBB6673128.1 response regulator transcription factor [Cohnella nanjingensis]
MYKVLIVDDEPFISEGLSDAVDWSAFGLEVVGTAENGEQALERLREAPADILITDISMPVMDGLELIRHARERLPQLKVIILSGYNEFDYLKQAMRLGIENYLLKPVHFEELHATLSGTVDKLNAQQAERPFGDDEIGILRDNVMYRYLTGRISPPEWAERTALLRIDLTKPYAAVAVLRAQGGAEAAYEAAEARFKEESAAVVFRDLEEDTVIVFGLDDPETGKAEAVRALESLADALEGHASPVRVSIGGACPMAEVGASYEQARKAQQFFLVLPDRAFVDYDRLPSADETAFPAELLSWDVYAKWVVAREQDALTDQIASDFQAIRAAEGLNPTRAKTAAIELVIRMKMEADKLSRGDRGEGFKEALERITGADSLEEVERAVQSAAQLSVESYSGEDLSPVIRQVLRHIESHYTEGLTLKSLGEQYHIHPNYLGHLFHKQTGDTFADRINKFRIDKAKELLKDSRLKVNEIARQVGYLEIGYFYKQFKKHVGISPSEYKGLL